MKNKKKAISIILLLLVLIFAGAITALCSGCRPSEIATYNVRREADNFNVYRRITVYNARTDMLVMEVEGFLSLSNNSTNEIQVIIQTGPETYKVDYIYLNDYVLYVVEDITGAEVDKYHYEVRFHPTIFRTVDVGVGEESDEPRESYQMEG